jgi:multiple sugar transport system substrate-binding protein
VQTAAVDWRNRIETAPVNKLVRIDRNPRLAVAPFYKENPGDVQGEDRPMTPKPAADFSGETFSRDSRNSLTRSDAVSTIRRIRYTIGPCGGSLGRSNAPGGSTVTDNLRALFTDAMTGKIHRRDLFTRGAALGAGAAALASLADLAANRALAAEDGKLTVTYYDWIESLHPAIDTVNADFTKTFPIDAQIAPTSGFGFDRFVTEAKSQKSTWDLYIGVTPFLEMIGLAESGTIEPWDPYLPAGLLDDLPASARAEGTYNGKFYVWPFVTDIIAQGWNAGIIEKAGLDPDKAPADWDEYLANSKKVQESGAAPYGCTFDFHDWRSLIPITHSFSTDVYTPDGLFDYTHPAAVQALEILKHMKEYANPDVAVEGTTDSGVANTPDEQVWSAQQVGYYVKFIGAHIKYVSNWTDPSQLRLAPLPIPPGGAGGTVFWNTGAVLFKYGKNKSQAAEYMKTLAYDPRIWEESIAGLAATGSVACGQLPPYASINAAWTANPPDFIKANSWVNTISAAIPSAKAIVPTVISVAQFTVARPEWLKYLNGEQTDAKVAMQNAANAVYAEWKKQTGKDAQLPVATPSS